MKKISIRRNRAGKSEIGARRSNMKRRLAVGIIASMAVAAIWGVSAIISTPDIVESKIEVSREAQTERTAPNLVDFQGGMYSGDLADASVNVIDERTAPNLVDFQNGMYSGDLADAKVTVIDERTAPNLVDFQNGTYSGE